MVKCAFDECENYFDPSTSKAGKKYCSVTCTRKANNKRGIERYYNRKKQAEDGSRKVCANPNCKAFIRKTSEAKYCDPCAGRAERKRQDDLRRRILGTNK